MENQELLKAIDLLNQAFTAISKIKDKRTTDYLLATASGLIKLNNLPVKLQNKFHSEFDVNKDIKTILPLLYDFSKMSATELTTFINSNYKDRSFLSMINNGLNRTLNLASYLSLMISISSASSNIDLLNAMSRQLEVLEQNQKRIQVLEAQVSAHIKQLDDLNAKL